MKIPFRDGDESDQLGARRYHASKRGAARKAKRSYNRRLRKALAVAMASYAVEAHHMHVEETPCVRCGERNAAEHSSVCAACAIGGA